MTADIITRTKRLARTIRGHTLRMVAKANASHVGSCLSAADLLAALHSGILRIDSDRPDWADRDRFLLSKGHAAAIYYAVLAECGFIPLSELATYCADGSRLTGHVSHKVPGVEFSTGSLGHGLSIGCGMALASRRDQKPWRVFVLLSDGELDEGSTWEAVLFAAHNRLSNLVAIVDYNKIQSFGAVRNVLNLDPLAEKWRAFSWSVREIDGHDVEQIADTFSSLPFDPAKPSAVIAHTVKGRGVSFMENDLAWHYRSPNTEQLQLALREVESGV